MRDLGRLHPSALEDWQGCGKRFEYAHDPKEKPAFRHPASINGTAIHRVIHLIHLEGLWDASRASIAEAYREAFHWAVENPVREKERGISIWWGELVDEDRAAPEFAADALAMLDGYRADPRNRDAAVLYQEALWRATFGGFDWEGTLDRADDLFDGTVALLDFKSSKDVIDEVPLQMWPQGLTYCMAMRHGVFRPVDAETHAPWSPISLKVSRVTWVQLRDYIPYLKGGKRKDGSTYKKGDYRGQVFHSVDVTDAMLDSHAREIEMLGKAVEGGRFERRPSNHQCTYRCKFNERCIADFTAGAVKIDPRLAIKEERNGD